MRELDQRHSDGITVSLDWDDETNAIQVTAADQRTGTVVSAIVPPHQAKEAFAHPYAFCAS